MYNTKALKNIRNTKDQTLANVAHPSPNPSVEYKLSPFVYWEHRRKIIPRAIILPKSAVWPQTWRLVSKFYRKKQVFN
jgi:hypothetical protein